MARMKPNPYLDALADEHRRVGHLEDEMVGDRMSGVRGRGPGEGRPGFVFRDRGNEKGSEYSGNDYSRVSGVGEVIHAPGPDFTQPDA